MPEMLVHGAAPYNAEPDRARLMARLVTGNDDFYVRCHGDVPLLDEATHRLRVDGLVRSKLDLSMHDLRTRFAQVACEAVLQCAGNRRADMQGVRPTSGDPWQVGAIGNARWQGVRLADVLDAAGIDRADASLHVAFECLDDCIVDGARFRYGASIGLPKALSPDVLLATGMNGVPLPPEHGFPLRLVVPGYAGVRSPKWLSRITVQTAPSDNPIQARDYRLLPPDVTAEAIDWSRGFAIEEMPVNAAICVPAPFAALPDGPVTIEGWAMASSRSIVRVDVSADGGRVWHQAELRRSQECGARSWTLWRIGLTLDRGRHELVVRAWDAAGQTQPSDVAEIWNVRGYLSNAWHRVQVEVG